MLYSLSLKNAVGSPSQMRYCLLRLCRLAKEKNITIIFIGHSTKEGYIAGLQTLQHAVDVVLFLRLNEDRTRLLKTKKNRFGSTENEVTLYMSKYGIFDYLEEKTPFGQIKNIDLTEADILRLSRKT